MRTLKDEIAYCRKNGLQRNEIDLKKLYFWLGERVSEDEELKSLRDEVFQLQGENLGMQSRLNYLESVLNAQRVLHD